MKIFLNWKQNGSFTSILNFINNLQETNHELVLFLPFPYLNFANNGKIKIGAQNVSCFKSGAFTGEVGADMLKEVGAKFCLIGHSERRKYFNENNFHLKSKIKLLKLAGITPVLCVGEELSERKSGIFFEKLKSQMEIFETGVIIAYEPIWAIGTGLVPSNEEISEIADFFLKNYKISVLYGGSVSEENIKNITSIKGIDGVLVGNASLDFNKVNKMI
jgi:triosephosphate isomerase